MKNFIITTLTIVGVLCFFSDPQVVNPDDWFHEWCQSAIIGLICLITARLGYLAKIRYEKNEEENNRD